VTDLATTLTALDKRAALDEARRRAAEGADAVALIEECRGAMEMVGRRFQDGDLYLADLLLAADVFSGVTDVLQPYLQGAALSGNRGLVVLATPRGDVHDLGKSIVATMLRASGFEVHDLGVDVEAERVVDEVRRLRPRFVGFSALLTTTLSEMKAAIDALDREGLRDGLEVLVGGGVTTPQFRDHVGADFQTLDVMAGVAYCLAASGAGGETPA